MTDSDNLTPLLRQKILISLCTHPLKFIAIAWLPLEEFLLPMGITQRQLAEAIHVSYQRIKELETINPLDYKAGVEIKVIFF